MNPEALDDMLAGLGLAVELRGIIWILFFVAGTALVSFIVSRVLVRIENRLTHTSNLWDDVLLHASRRPIQAFIWVQGIYWAAEVAYRFSEAAAFTYNELLLRFGFIVLIAWALLRFVHQAEEILISDRVKEPMDYTTVSALSKLARAVIVITSALVLIQNMGYSISGVLALGGVGGIAIGFAARDMLANFFGGAIVYIDKPFKVGDWIRSPDANVEGIVEHIGWRITRIRTFDLRPLYVPNAIFTTIAVENPSRMFHRRIFETVGVRYADVEKIERIVESIRSMLAEHEDIAQDQTNIVNFITFNTSSLDIMIYTFTKTRQWVEFHRIKQDVMLRVSQIIRDRGAEVAFPTRTLHIEGDGRGTEPQHAGMHGPGPEQAQAMIGNTGGQS